MKQDEKGYIVVETITAFMLLVLLMISILSLVNIAVVQSRVHYALTQAAESVSLYSYTLEVTGISEHLKGNAAQAELVQAESDTFQANVNKLLSGLQTLSAGQTVEAGKAAAVQVKGWVDDTVQDPKQTIRLLLNYGLNKAGNAAYSELMRPLVGHYLTDGSLSGDEFLKAFHVSGGLEGLDFTAGKHGSALMDSQGDVWLSVRYEIDYAFGALPLPFLEPTLQVEQTVKTKAWGSGKGEGYWK